MLTVLTAAGQVYMLSQLDSPVLAYARATSSGIAFLPNQSTAVIADARQRDAEPCDVVMAPPVTCSQ